MEKYLGVSNLITKAGEGAVSSVLGSKKYVLLYFSASWCGPCKAFTPKLVDFYNKHKDSKDFEIIFVSRDNDEKSFKEYYTHHPWPAVYGKNITDPLSAKLKIKGIPTLAVLDATQPETPITTDGRMGVMIDASAESFPWAAGLTTTIFAKTCLKGADSVAIDDAVKGKDYVFLYFSASWCGPCKAFTPKLVEFYNKHKDAKKFEVIFMSLDRDEKSFKEYFSHMPWHAVYGQNVQAAASILEVKGIPSLMLYDLKANKIVSKNGTSEVTGDAEAINFPWPTTAASLVGAKEVIANGGTSVPLADVVARTDYILLYFSASWCPPCKAFTPKLVEFYNKHKNDKKFEVIFMSLDRDEGSFKEYFSHMPWLASYGPNVQGAAGKVGLEGVPTLIVLDKAGNVVMSEGVEAVMQDPEASEFPWQ